MAAAPLVDDTEHQLLQAAAGSLVQGRGRLVQQLRVRNVRQGARQRDALRSAVAPTPGVTAARSAARAACVLRDRGERVRGRCTKDC